MHFPEREGKLVQLENAGEPGEVGFTEAGQWEKLQQAIWRVMAIIWPSREQWDITEHLLLKGGMGRDQELDFNN